jgi:hypothetical protein
VLCSLGAYRRFRGAIIALVMEAVRTSETSVSSNEITRRCIAEDSNHPTGRRENLKFVTKVVSCIWYKLRNADHTTLLSCTNFVNESEHGLEMIIFGGFGAVETSQVDDNVSEKCIVSIFSPEGFGGTYCLHLQPWRFRRDVLSPSLALKVLEEHTVSIFGLEGFGETYCLHLQPWRFWRNILSPSSALKVLERRTVSIFSPEGFGGTYCLRLQRWRFRRNILSPSSAVKVSVVEHTVSIFSAEDQYVSEKRLALKMETVCFSETFASTGEAYASSEPTRTLWSSLWTFRFCKRRGIPWLAELPSVSREGLCCMELLTGRVSKFIVSSASLSIMPCRRMGEWELQLHAFCNSALTKWRWVVSFMLHPLYPQGTSLVLIE